MQCDGSSDGRAWIGEQREATEILQSALAPCLELGRVSVASASLWSLLLALGFPGLGPPELEKQLQIL